MKDKVFIDSNLWIYLFADNSEKQIIVEQIISIYFKDIIVSTQILNETYNVLYKKIKLHHSEIKQIILKIIESFSIAEVSHYDVSEALEIKGEYNFSYWDSLIIASAIKNRCNILFSEDLQHNQVINNSLKIINPFF